MVGQTSAIGLGLAAVVAGIFGLTLGPLGAVAAGSFGFLATVVQTAAVAMARPKLAEKDYHGLLARWGAGSLLRLLGVVLIPVAVAIDRDRFAPLPAAFGYLGVLVPLFLFEVRRFR